MSMTVSLEMYAYLVDLDNAVPSLTTEPTALGDNPS
jgi:hypothetical protein